MYGTFNLLSRLIFKIILLRRSRLSLGLVQLEAKAKDTSARQRTLEIGLESKARPGGLQQDSRLNICANGAPKLSSGSILELTSIVK